ncbi:MAG: phosphoribosyl transferase [Spirochaeta sp. LUC14_002_19_P3]|nr:MAG: phosphoribosyl transferase [Spirochaeta sp. LUC14_002_19_P3]
MKKDFISADTVRNNALQLAKRIYDDGFIPDIIYVSLRGGAFLGNIISEFFKIINPNEKPVFYAAVVARSYMNIQQQECVQIDGWTYSPNYLRSGDRVLFVDDIYDTGKTISYLADCVMAKGLPREHIKIAVHDYKRSAIEKQTPIQPDYWCRELKTDGTWIHYLSHELEGLSAEEIQQYYLNPYPELNEVFSALFP